MTIVTQTRVCCAPLMVGIRVLTRVHSNLSGLHYSWCFCDRAGCLAKDNKIYMCNLSGLSVEENEDADQ